MQPLAVELSLLRSLETAEMRIAPGRVLTARVIELLPNGRGMLSIAGAAIEAQIPSQLRAGQELRLQVRDVTGGRVLLSVAHHATAPPPPPPIVPLPGGGTVTTRARDDQDQDEAGGSGAGTANPDHHTVSLRYQATNLGPIDLTFSLHPSMLTVNVTLTPGSGLGALQSRADELRTALTAKSDRPVTVTVGPRREPLDVYA
jgi:hypothetical protein